MFLQRWRSLYRRYLSNTPKVEHVDIFSDNILPLVKYPLKMQFFDTFKDITEKGLKCEKGLLEQGIIKNSKDVGVPSNASADKPKFWSRNKNITNDGMVDARVVNIAQPTL